MDLAEKLYGDSTAVTSPGTTEQPSAAERLYGNQTKTEPAKAEHPLDQEARQSQALYGDKPAPEIALPDAVKAIRADPERRLFGGDQLKVVLPDAIKGLEDAPKELVAAAVAETREIAMDLGFSREDVVSLRAVGEATQEMPTPEAVAAWEADATQALKDEFGDGWEKALADAQKLVQRDPRVAKMLQVNRRGSHPDVVLAFAKAAKQAKVRGKL